MGSERCTPGVSAQPGCTACTATPLPAFVPVLMFAVLFGLSMDYEVFLVSRMREGWLRTRDNERAILGGLRLRQLRQHLRHGFLIRRTGRDRSTLAVHLRRHATYTCPHSSSDQASRQRTGVRWTVDAPRRPRRATGLRDPHAAPPGRAHRPVTGGENEIIISG